MYPYQPVLNIVISRCACFHFCIPYDINLMLPICLAWDTSFLEVFFISNLNILFWLHWTSSMWLSLSNEVAGKVTAMNYPKKHSRTVGIFYKIRHCLPSGILRILYYSLFYSFLSYGIFVWCLPLNLILRNFQLSRKRLLKWWLLINKLLHQNLFSLILNSWNWWHPSIPTSLFYVYDCQDKSAPAYFRIFFVQCAQTHSYSTRLAFRGDLFLERKYILIWYQINWMQWS